MAKRNDAPKVRISSLETAERSAVAEREAPAHVKALYGFHDTIENGGSVVGRINEATWLQGHNFSLSECATLAGREKTGLARAFTISKARNEGMTPPFVEPVSDYAVMIADDAERFPSWDAALAAISRREASERSLAKYVKATRDADKDPVALSTLAHRVLLSIYNSIKKVESEGRPKQGIPPIKNIRDLVLSCLSGIVPEAGMIEFAPFPPKEIGEAKDIPDAEEAGEEIEAEELVEA